MRLRKIVTSWTAHNSAALIVAACTLAALAGCGGDQGQDTPATTDGSTPSRPCPVVVTDQGIRLIYDVASRVETGADVTLEEMGRLFASPVYDRWRRSYTNEKITQGFLGRMLFVALRGEEDLPERLRTKGLRVDIIRAFTESVDKRQNIEATAVALQDGEVLCRVYDELRGWVPDADLPDTLRVDLLLGYPEMRSFEGHIMVDASLAWAAGELQLPRFIAAMLYKELDTMEGPAPKNTRGQVILLESLRLVRNLVAPAMIERTDSIVFDRRHEVLGGNGPDPVSIYEQAYRTLLSLDHGLTRVRGLESTTDEDWLQLYRLFIGAQSWQATAWYMGQIIEERLGLEVLQQNLHSVAGLYATYQEACLARPDESTEPRGSVRWFRDRPPRFSAENAAWLETELTERFGG